MTTIKIDIVEAAKRLSCQPQTIRRKLKRGQFPAPTRIGNKYMFAEAEIEDYHDAEKAKVEAEFAARRAKAETQTPGQ